MYAEKDGDKIRLFWDQGTPFFVFYNIRTIARDLARSELVAFERIVYKEAFRYYASEIPIPKRLRKRVAMKLMEIELDRII